MTPLINDDILSILTKNKEKIIKDFFEFAEPIYWGEGNDNTYPELIKEYINQLQNKEPDDKDIIINQLIEHLANKFADKKNYTYTYDRDLIIKGYIEGMKIGINLNKYK